jgi:hypothetical protein
MSKKGPMDKQWSTNQYTQKFNTILSIDQRWTKAIRKGSQFLHH